MAEHWSWLTGCEPSEYTYSPPTRPSRPPHRPLVKVATSAHLHTMARYIQSTELSAPLLCWFLANGDEMQGFLVLVMMVVCVSSETMNTAEVMSHVTAHYGKALEECREESGLSKDVLEEFQHFWSEDFEVVHRELGCAIMCMSNKLSLLQDDARIHHVNMHDYVKSFPQGDILSETMVNLIHNCEKQYDDITDECSRVVKVAACFKVDAKKAGIAPEVAMIEAVMEKY